MRKRYQCMLWPWTGTNPPKRWVALSARPIQGGETGAVEWSACWWRTERGRALAHSLAFGDSKSSWWDLFTTLLTAKGEVWCVVDHAYNAMTALGLWGRIEEGSLRAGRLVDDDTGLNVVDDTVCTTDFALLYDPPFVMRLGIPGRPGRMLIVDARNYGLEICNEGKSLPNHASELAGVVSQILDTLKAHRGPSLQATAGATAWAWWRMRWMPPGVMVHTHSDALALERAALHGGRCEAYRLGAVDEHATAVDIRAAYPAVCVDTPLPVRFIDYGVDSEPKVYGEHRGDVGYIADVTVEVDVAIAPCPREGLVLFPVGSFRTQLCGPELEMVKRYARVIKTHAWAAYEMAPILSQAQQSLWALRKMALSVQDRHLDSFIKACMVALVGKFAQRGRTWVARPGWTAERPWGNGFRVNDDDSMSLVRYIGWRCEEQVDIGEAPYSCPAIAAWVYSAQRARLWYLMRDTGHENVYYCDTDGIIVSPEGYGRLERIYPFRAPDIGSLRVVRGPGRLDVRGVKHYIHCGVIKRSGLGARRSVIPPLPSRDLLLPNQSGYRHGIVGNDGRITPWRLTE